MNVIAWISFIINMFSVVYGVIYICLEKDKIDRIGYFIGTLLCSIPAYFFYVYLFR